MSPSTLPSTLEPEGRKVFHLALISHTAVSYTKGQGVGICLVQHAESHGRPGVRFTKDDTLSLTRQRKFGIKREDITIQNVKTRERAYMLAISHALRLARQTIKTYSATREDVAVNKVRVLSDSGDAVALINQRLQNAPMSLDDIASTNERNMIVKVLAEVWKLEKHGV